MTDLEAHTDRRRLLRRAGTLAAGMAGAGVAGAVAATPAQARAAIANSTVPIYPTRVVDTRHAADRWRIVNPAVLDSAGRLPRNQTMDVNLTDLASFPDAVISTPR